MLKCRSGVGAVEFALAMPMLVVLLLGLGDLALAVNQKMRLNAAARAGAQWAYAHSGDTSGVASAVRLASGLDGAAITTSATSFCGCSSGAAAACDSTCADGNGLRTYVSVTVSQDFVPVLDFLSGRQLASTAILRVK